MKNKYDWGSCSRCKKEITEDNFGDCIEGEEVIICDSCARKHSLYIIKELEKFRQSKEFEDVIALRKKVLWASESLGNLFDNATGTIKESVSDYDNYNVFELQSFLLGILETEIENYILPNGLDDDIDECIKKNPGLNKLRLDIRKQQGKILSYVDWGEFLNK